MSKIIKNDRIVDDRWDILRLAEGQAADALDLTGEALIVPLPVWLSRREEIIARKQPFGVWLDSNQDPAEIGDAVDAFAVIAVNFPKFTDGRGYSIAALLRSRYAYTGELRAIGDVLRDQLFYMQRVGFNSFAVRADKDIYDAVNALKDFSETYQGSVDQPLPLFKRLLAYGAAS